MGGGGSSGSVDYPDHMKSFLYNWLFGFDDDTLTDELSNSITDAMNTAYSNSPYTSAVAYDPDTALGGADTAISSFATLVAALDYTTDFPTAITVALAQIPSNTPAADTTTLDTPSLDTATLDTATLDTATLDTPTLDTATLDSVSIDETRVDNSVDAYEDNLEAQLTDTILPKFKAGMLNIGAVNSSAFVIGEAIIRAQVGRDVAKYSADLRIELMKLYDELNTRFKLQRREIDRDFSVKYRDSIKEHALQRRQIDAQHAIRYREATQAFILQRREIEARHKLRYSEAVQAQTIAYRTIEGELKRDYRARLQNEANEFRKQVLVATVEMLSDLMKLVTMTGDVAKLVADQARVKIISKKEEITEQLDFDERDARWYIESFQYGANLLASISGGTSNAGQKRPSQAVSAFGGALSGAAAGSAINVPFGTIAGAVVGGALGAASY